MFIHHTKGIMDYIHYDLWMSKGEAQYLLIFIDDYSRQVWMYFLKRKGDVVITFNKGVARHYTIRITPQQNRIAEYMNMTFLSKARYMLS
jgi:hypothetical protein